MDETSPKRLPAVPGLFFFLFFHKQTLVKSVADRFLSPPPTMRLTSRKRHLLLRHVHTEFFSFFFSLFFFFVQQYQRGAKAKMIHTQREKKKTGKNERNIIICALL